MGDQNLNNNKKGGISKRGLLWTAVAFSTTCSVVATAEEVDLGKIKMEGGMTWFLQGTDGFGTADTTALSYTLDLALSSKIGENGQIVIALEGGNGDGIDGTIGSLSTTAYDPFVTELSGTSGQPFNSFSISQAYYEGEFADGSVVIDAGKLDFHSMYDDNAYANDETDQFMSGIFTRLAGTVYHENEHYYAPGVAATIGVSEMMDLTLGVVNAGRLDSGNSGFNNYGDNVNAVVQVNFKPKLMDRDGNYRFYFIDDERKGWTDAESGDKTNNTAMGISFDQALTDNAGVFLRYSVQDDSILQNVVDSSWSLGASFNGAAWGRSDDVAGIGYGSVNLNNKDTVLADFQSSTGIANPDDETHVEVYYKIGFSDQFTLTPDVQVITNNGGDSDSDTITVYGMRGQLNF